MEERSAKEREEYKAAMRSYQRKRSLRGFLTGVMCIGIALAPSVFDLQPPSQLICYLGAATLWFYYQTEIRLKTMQIRLAQMHDILEKFAGTAERKDENYIGELTD